MRQYLTLVKLFWQQLIRRKSLWIIVALVGVVMLISFAVQSQMRSMLEQGVRYDIATRRASATLEQYAEQIREFGVILAIIVGSLVAPPSRRDGTTQFVLTLSVSRSRIALAQYGSLALLVAMGTVLVHAGYMVTAYSLGTMQWSEALFAWAAFVGWLLLAAAVSFALSLTRPALLVYGMLLGIPYLLLPILGELAGRFDRKVSIALRLGSARWVDNCQMLFPRFASVIAWPRLAVQAPPRPPFAALGLEVLHLLAAAGFWIVIGLWAYRRHDFGSRTPLK